MASPHTFQPVNLIAETADPSQKTWPASCTSRRTKPDAGNPSTPRNLLVWQCCFDDVALIRKCYITPPCSFWDVNDGKPLFRGEKQSGPGDKGLKTLKIKYGNLAFLMT